MSTDVCVPISRLSECLVETQKDLDTSSLPIVVAGHVGDGNFHLGFLIDRNDPANPDSKEPTWASKGFLVWDSASMGTTPPCGTEDGCRRKANRSEDQKTAISCILCGTGKSKTEIPGLIHPWRCLVDLRSQPRIKLIVLCACIACLSAGTAWGQAMNSAQVTGTVTDSSGAVIPGVTVTANDLDRNTERVVTTNDAGVFDTGPLSPGDRYEILFKKTGFSTLRRGPMTLRVGSIGMNAELAVGQTTSEIVVRAEAPILETTSSEKSQTLPADTLAALPQVGAPDWQTFIILLPGTSGTGNTNTVGMEIWLTK